MELLSASEEFVLLAAALAVYALGWRVRNYIFKRVASVKILRRKLREKCAHFRRYRGCLESTGVPVAREGKPWWALHKFNYYKFDQECLEKYGKVWGEDNFGIFKPHILNVTQKSPKMF